MLTQWIEVYYPHHLHLDDRINIEIVYTATIQTDFLMTTK